MDILGILKFLRFSKTGFACKSHAKPAMRLAAILAVTICLIALLPQRQALAGGDSIRIVSITPDAFENYRDEVTFEVIADYTLESVDEGIVYLGFNTLEPRRYHLVDEIQVQKGSGTLVLRATVTPVGWGTPDSPSGPMQGSMELLNGDTFSAYVNLSQNPHPESWDPLAKEVLKLKRGTPTRTLPITAPDPSEGMGFVAPDTPYSLFASRLEEPELALNPYYMRVDYGGLNYCILGSNQGKYPGSVMPNCVGYAWGRAYELLGHEPSLSMNNAGTWYFTDDGYSRGSEPRLGAIMCWTDATAPGHVAVVEAISPDGSTVTISESSWLGDYFATREIPKDGNDGVSGRRFWGYIYIGDWTCKPSEPTVSAESGICFEDGTVGWTFSWNECPYATAYAISIYDMEGTLIKEVNGIRALSYDTRLASEGSYRVTVASANEKLYPDGDYLTIGNSVDFKYGQVSRKPSGTVRPKSH